MLKDLIKENLLVKEKDVVRITFKGYKELDNYLRKLKLENEKQKYECERILIEILAVISIVSALLGWGSNISWLKVFTIIFSIIVIIILFWRFFSLGKLIKK